MDEKVDGCSNGDGGMGFLVFYARIRVSSLTMMQIASHKLLWSPRIILSMGREILRHVRL
jgi:hypothetical protein